MALNSLRVCSSSFSGRGRRMSAVLAGFGVLAFGAVGMSVLGVGSLLVSAGSAEAGPQPRAVPERWELDFRPGPLRAAVVETAETGPRAYLYMTYTVINRSGEELLFAPSFIMTTDEGDVVRSGEGVPPEVTAKLKADTQNPLIQDQIEILGRLGRGVENAREGVVVFRADGLKVDEFTIFAHGFSGDTHTYVRPDNGETVVLRKAFQMRFALPGTLQGRGLEPLARTGEPDRWVLR